ncbi:hypothetical protein BHE90_012748 [Fusarium euwallaceae]|uniref:Uncharacterized protein n=2 Tax=Fusarium solani species complex TaxID=232080 RepID=A0A430LAS6_9HYPO|nr:hypothetical protein CDV31_015678 [Fusarium ambrosium]RTE72836.1 hypothetical protein BHE90_012748 [Fusarium euwallaceae]
MSYSSYVSPLRDSITDWSRALEKIRDPDVVFDEELAMLHHRSREQLEQFSLDPSQENLSLVQKELLFTGHQIKELTLNHAATRLQKQQTCDEATEVLVENIIQDLVKIFGLLTLQRLSTKLLSPETGQEHGIGPVFRKPSSPNHLFTEDEGSPSHQLRTEAEESSVNSPTTGNRGIKRKRRAGIKPVNGKRPRQESKELLQAGITRHDPPVAAVSPFAVPESPYKHNTTQKDIIRKRGFTLARKSISLGRDGHTSCFVAYKSPIHNQWICAMHIPEGQSVPSIDAIIAEKLRIDPAMRHLSLDSRELEDQPVE